MEICSLCNRSFKNKNSLRSHKSRFRREKDSSTHSYHEKSVELDGAESSDNEDEIDLQTKRRKSSTIVDSEKMYKVLNLIENHLKEQSSQEKYNCFDLLESYILKHEVFGNLESHFSRKGLNLIYVFTEKELSFSKLVLSTEDVSTVSKVLNENINIVKSITKHVEHSLKQNNLTYEKGEVEYSMNDDNLISNMTETYSCEICNETFKDAAKFTDHRYRCHKSGTGSFLPNVKPSEVNAPNYSENGQEIDEN